MNTYLKSSPKVKSSRVPFPDIKVPGWLLCRKGISKGAKLYYGLIKGEKLSRREAAERLGRGERSVSRYRAELKKHKLIEGPNNEILH